MALENKVEYTFYRDHLERSFGKLTDKEWEVLASELEDAIEASLLELASDIVDNLPHLVEQDRKYDSDREK